MSKMSKIFNGKKIIKILAIIIILASMNFVFMTKVNAASHGGGGTRRDGSEVLKLEQMKEKHLEEEHHTIVTKPKISQLQIL